jgi:hypothetical protein
VGFALVITLLIPHSHCTQHTPLDNLHDAAISSALRLYTKILSTLLTSTAVPFLTKTCLKIKVSQPGEGWDFLFVTDIQSILCSLLMIILWPGLSTVFWKYSVCA